MHFLGVHGASGTGGLVPPPLGQTAGSLPELLAFAHMTQTSSFVHHVLRTYLHQLVADKLEHVGNIIQVQDSVCAHRTQTCLCSCIESHVQ
jgi:hypothetical protein